MRLLQGVTQSPEAFCEDQSWSEPGAHLRILPERAMPVENSLHGAAEHPLRDPLGGLEALSYQKIPSKTPSVSTVKLRALKNIHNV